MCGVCGGFFFFFCFGFFFSVFSLTFVLLATVLGLAGGGLWNVYERRLKARTADYYVQLNKAMDEIEAQKMLAKKD
jgi:hypothetical protein